MYAEVIVRSNTVYTDNLFTYKIPEFLEDVLRVGHRVLVPVGKGNKPIEAFVFKIKNNFGDEKGLEEENSDKKFKIKEIVDILDEEPLFLTEQLELVHWMKNRYICTYMECINMIYPKGLKLKNYKVAVLKNDYLEKMDSLSDDEKKVAIKISENKGKIKVEKLKYLENINNILHRMKNKGVVDIKWEYANTKNEKNMCFVSLRYDEDDTEEYISENKIRIGNKQREIIEFLKLNEEAEINDIVDILKVSKQSINSLKDRGLLDFTMKAYYRKPESRYSAESKKIELNEQQREVAEVVKNEMFDEDKKPYILHGITGSGKTEVYMDIVEYALSQGLDQREVAEVVKNEMFDEDKKPYILHGITGSGKTEVYMDIVEYALSQGLDSIILVPEISLTPQTVARIKNRFGDIVGVFHSQLSEGEKHDVFRAVKKGEIRILIGASTPQTVARIKNRFGDIVGVFHSQLSEGEKHDVFRAVKKGEIRILIGARSALFAPFRSLGVVIIDEFHESAYKSEMNPKFSALEVARYMSFKNNVTLVMGSATPSVEEYYKAKNGEYKLLKIDKRANSKPLPKIEVVDMKAELGMGNKSIFSSTLGYTFS